MWWSGFCTIIGKELLNIGFPQMSVTVQLKEKWIWPSWWQPVKPKPWNIYFSEKMKTCILWQGNYYALSNYLAFLHKKSLNTSCTYYFCHQISLWGELIIQGLFIFKMSKSSRYMRCLNQIVLPCWMSCVIASDSERTMGLDNKEIAWDLERVRMSTILS